MMAAGSVDFLVADHIAVQLLCMQAWKVAGYLAGDESVVLGLAEE
jgi:hypothetical protein